MPLVKVDASFVLLKAADVSTYTAVVLPAYMPTYLPPYLLHTCLDKYPHAYQNKHTCTDIQSKPLVSRKGGGGLEKGGGVFETPPFLKSVAYTVSKHGRMANIEAMGNGHAMRWWEH